MLREALIKPPLIYVKIQLVKLIDVIKDILENADIIENTSDVSLILVNLVTSYILCKNLTLKSLKMTCKNVIIRWKSLKIKL